MTPPGVGRPRGRHQARPARLARPRWSPTSSGLRRPRRGGQQRRQVRGSRRAAARELARAACLVGADGRGARVVIHNPDTGHPGRSPCRRRRGRWRPGSRWPPPPASRSGSAGHRQPGPHRRRLSRTPAQPGVRHRRASRPRPGRPDRLAGGGCAACATAAAERHGPGWSAGPASCSPSARGRRRPLRDPAAAGGRPAEDGGADDDTAMAAAVGDTAAPVPWGRRRPPPATWSCSAPPASTTSTGTCTCCPGSPPTAGSSWAQA